MSLGGLEGLRRGHVLAIGAEGGVGGLEICPGQHQRRRGLAAARRARDIDELWHTEALAQDLELGVGEAEIGKRVKDSFWHLRVNKEGLSCVIPPTHGTYNCF